MKRLFLLPIVGLTLSWAQTTESLLPENLAPDSWKVLGPFPNLMLPEPGPGGISRAGFTTDFLEVLGGEARAVIRDDTKVVWDGVSRTVIPASLADNGQLDFNEIFPPPTDNQVAYAYTDIVLEAPTTWTLHFGSDDSGRVWANGNRVLDVWTSGREAQPSQEVIPVNLAEGTNRLLIKVENGPGGWQMFCQLYDDEGQRRENVLEWRRNASDLRIIPDNAEDFILWNPAFPELAFERPKLAKTIFRDTELKPTWYNVMGVEVERPDQPGRYYADITLECRDGLPFRTLVGVYRPGDTEWMGRYSVPPYDRPSLIGMGTNPWLTLSADELQAHRTEISRQVWASMGRYMTTTEDGAALFAWMEEREATPDRVSNEHEILQGSFVEDLRHRLALRMRLEKRTPVELRPVEILREPAPQLHSGTEAEAGIRIGTVEKLRAYARQWTRDDPSSGLRIIVARNRVIFMREAFPSAREPDIEIDSLFAPASIGKLVAGQVMARFFDQGIVTPDTPLGDVLPDFPTDGPRAITYRDCWTHLSGMTGHTTARGIFNPYLDNNLNVQAFSLTTPRLRRHYSGDGNNLAGMAMSLLAGKDMVTLLQENILDPLGEGLVTQTDLGYGAGYTADFLVRVGQMILNRGSYGPYRFYSPETFDAILPKRLIDYVPTLNDPELEWGIGMEWMLDPMEADPEDAYLGGNVIGHGSATASTLRIDLDHNLVVVIGRDDPGDYAATLRRNSEFIRILAGGLLDR
ncbi:MAG: serine hydrolase [Opitutaceae bacterium]